mmetsp:Transcript_11502/g.37805  ORF Transcript_11502/g.37805 Transcript_11502/m.37805 type:complete len:163 (+) Transcript_11502:45-533(+)
MPLTATQKTRAEQNKAEALRKRSLSNKSESDSTKSESDSKKRARSATSSKVTAFFAQSSSKVSKFPSRVEPTGSQARGGFNKGISTRERKQTPWCYCGQRALDKLAKHHSVTIYVRAGICGPRPCELKLHPDQDQQYKAALAAAKRPCPGSPDEIRALYSRY